MGRLSSILAAGLVGAILLAGTRPGAAQMRPLDSSGFVGPVDVDAAVGDRSFDVVCPADEQKRVVRITLSKSGEGYRRPGVLSTLLRYALINYWQSCDKRVLGITNAPVRLVEIYAPARQGEPPRLALTAGPFEPFTETWRTIVDVRKREEGQGPAGQAAAAGGPTFQEVPFYDGPPEFPDTGAGWNLDAQADLKKEFGEPRYSMKVCSKTTKVVKIEPQFFREKNNDTYNMMYGGITPGVREVLRRAIIFAWKNCPRDSSPDPYMIQSASIYAPNGEERYRAEGLKRDAGERGPLDGFAGQKIYVHYTWQNFIDLRHIAYMERLARENAQWWENFWFTLKLLFWLVIGGSIGGVLLWNWENIAYAYFYYLYPHPARHVVQGALDRRGVLDGPALAAILGELPPGSSVFRKVRLDQGEVLVSKMQTLSNLILAEQARAAAAQNERRAAENYERAAYETIQEAIALAAAALERAKAAWQAGEAIRRGGKA